MNQFFRILTVLGVLFFGMRTAEAQTVNLDPTSAEAIMLAGNADLSGDLFSEGILRIIPDPSNPLGYVVTLDCSRLHQFNHALLFTTLPAAHAAEEAAVAYFVSIWDGVTPFDELTGESLLAYEAAAQAIAERKSLEAQVPILMALLNNPC